MPCSTGPPPTAVSTTLAPTDAPTNAPTDAPTAAPTTTPTPTCDRTQCATYTKRGMRPLLEQMPATAATAATTTPCPVQQPRYTQLRILSPSSISGWALDVYALNFFDDDMQLIPIAAPLDSGNAGGNWGPSGAVQGSGNWGGRKFNGEFFIGMDVQGTAGATLGKVTFRQNIGSHNALAFSVQGRPNGGSTTWVDIQNIDVTKECLGQGASCTLSVNIQDAAATCG